MNYLYNGVELPALPDWDKEKYPYAYIVKNYYADKDGYEYGLVLAKKTVAVRCIGEDMNTVGYYVFLLDILHKCIDGAWTEGVPNYGFSWGLEGFVVWSNRDVYYSTGYEPLGSLAGTLYLAASDPIHVLSFDRTALVMGWHIGRMLKAMRGKKPTEPDTPVEPEYDVVFENGVLYIKKAPAVMVGTTLSLAALDIKGGD